MMSIIDMNSTRTTSTRLRNKYNDEELNLIISDLKFYLNKSQNNPKRNKEKFVKVKDILAFLASVSYQKVNGKIERVNIDHRKIEKALIDLNKNCHLPTIITYLHKESKGE